MSPQRRQRRGGADPDMKPALGKFLAEIALELHRAQLDRALALVIAAYRIRHHRQHPIANVGIAGQLLRARHLRHFGLVGEPGLDHVKRHRHGKDRVAVLDRHHPAGVASGLGGGLARRAVGNAVPTGGSLWTFAIMPE
jgi:hypothetical protein